MILKKQDICFMSACEMAENIKTQALTSQEITEVIIERIEKINPIVNAYCTPTFELARELAKNADDAIKKNEKMGLLPGIPTSIKDETLTKGIRTTFGCKMLENYIPNYDDVAVGRLKKAGAVILGKTNTPTMGFKPITDNLIFGETKNPWDIRKTSGGSSGGAAAAVASGLGPLATGSDGGGSIRIPSSLCGVYGLKPTFGRIPHVVMRSNGYLGTLYHKGPITRYVQDAALMLDVMAGPHHTDRYSLPKENSSFLEKTKDIPNKLKIGFSLDLGFIKALDPEIKEAVLNSIQKFEALDWTTQKVKMRIKEAEATLMIFWTTGFAYPLRPYLAAWEDKLDPDLVEGIKIGLNYSTQEIKAAEINREMIFEEVNKIFKNCDVLITPTSACNAFELGKLFPDEIDGIKFENVVSNMVKWVPFTYPFNLTGHPAASIPCGWSKEGLPIGMQIVGKRFDEATVLQVSKVFEEIAPWQERKPNFT